MPFHKSWKQRRRHSSFCSSVTEVPAGVARGDTTATTSISASGVGVASSSGIISHRNSVTNADGLTVVGASRRCSEQQQHFVVMDIINEDKVEV